MTFYQPPAYVHILNKKSWLDRAVTWQPVDAASAKLCSPDSPKPATTPLSVSIQAASDGSVVVIRIVNSGSTKGTTVDIADIVVATTTNHTISTTQAFRAAGVHKREYFHADGFPDRAEGREHAWATNVDLSD
jgi:hypothetical protein